MEEQILTNDAELAELTEPDTSFDPDELDEPSEGAILLEEVSQFIGRYLQCTEHQRTILALWVLHTHSLPAAQITPYLSIQSREKQSGKTLCLQLLSLLCESPALTSGFTANAITRRIDGPISTVLLDECQATVGTRTRSKAPALRAILATGYHCSSGYMDATHERSIFSPKAFAGMGQLPEALADRSISIILEPLGAPSAAKSKVERFDLRRALKDAKHLQEQLHGWAEENDPEFEEFGVYSEEAFPPNLSPRRRDMIEPLLQLADFVGGDWPKRIREALAGIFEAETAFELRHSLQLLADIRDCFAHHNYPSRLSTSALLEWMNSLPSRPWDMNEAGSITARTFARLLLPFEVRPRVQRIGPGDPARGYQLQDFLEAWKAHLGFSVPADRPVAESAANAQSAGQRQVTDQRESEIANKNAVCNAVTHSDAVSVSNGEAQELMEGFSDDYRIPPQHGSGNGLHNTLVSAS
jgi:hypothetical protein